MRPILIALSFLLLVPACVDSASVHLPRVATVGATPAELGLDHVVVTVTADGRILTRDGEVAPTALTAWLTPHADRARDTRYPQLPSHTHFVIRCDVFTPWSAVGAVLRAASDPDNRINRVLFAVRPVQAGDDREGAFAWFLPLDRCVGSGPERGGPTALFSVKPNDSLHSVLFRADALHRAGYRPWVTAGGGQTVRLVTEDGEVRAGTWDGIAVPDELPARSSDLAGVTVLWEMVEPIIEDVVELPEDDDLPVEEHRGD